MDINSILENLRLETGAPFTFEASNVDGLYKYLATVCLNSLINSFYIDIIIILYLD